MGNRNGAAARRKSKRLAKADVHVPAAETDTQQPSSPDSTPVQSGTNYDHSQSVNFAAFTANNTLPLDNDGDRSSSITPPPSIKRKAPAKAPKTKAKKAAKKAVDLSEDALSSDSDAPPPPKKKKLKGVEPAVLHDDQRSAYLICVNSCSFQGLFPFASMRTYSECSAGFRTRQPAYHVHTCD
jgi:hypothetical protein